MENFDIFKTLAMVFALIIAIVGHEIMHGFIAYKYGDDTAKNQGRLSINPIKHIDPVGTILLPAMLYITNAGFLFGWAKPVPVFMPTVIGNGKYMGAINVSLAGVAYNFTLAIVASIILKTGVDFGEFLTMFLLYCVQINVVLGIFNLLPIPPLDGFNALGFALAKFGFANITNKLFKYSKYGMVVLILIIATPISDYIFAPMHYVIRWLLM